MMKPIKIVEDPTVVRDPNSRAILSVDKSGQAAARKKIKDSQTLVTLSADIKMLKNELNILKLTLFDLTNGPL